MASVVIPLAKPEITEADELAVLQVLQSGILSGGPVVPAFEEAMAHYCGVPYAVAMNSGTSALHCAVKALGIAAPQEVITTPFSFIASANCLLMEQAVPVFVDIDSTYNIDCDQIDAAITRHTTAILAVDVFGRCADWTAITTLADRHGLTMVEDACEALGAQHGERKAGAWGDISCVAFYPNKQITTGEGGMLLTSDEALAHTARSLSNQGRDEDDDWFTHRRLGYNYRMTEMQAALGLSQCRRIDDIFRRRAQVAAWYQECFAGCDWLHLPAPDQRSWFVYVVRLCDEMTGEDRDRIMKALRAEQIECRAYFTPIHLQPFYRHEFGYKPGDFPITEHVADRTIALPFFTTMTQQQVRCVAETLQRIGARPMSHSAPHP